MAKITLTTIIEELAARTGMSKDAADNFVHTIVDTILKGLYEDNLVKIKGLGTFKLMEMSDRGSVDINTGERITIKGYRKVTFTPDSAMKEFVNRPFAHFEPTELNDGYPSEEEELPVAEEETKVEESEDSQQLPEPIAEAPIVEEPAAEVSIVEAPVTEEPIEEEPIEEESVEEESVIEEPVAEIPVAETPVEEDTAEEITPAETEVVEEPEPEVIDPEPSPAEEAPEQEEEPVVAPQEEEPVVVPQEEELVVVPQEEEPALEATSENADTASKKPTKRGILGWVVVILLIAIAFGLYYYKAKDLYTQSDEYYEKFDDLNGMMVNPNLREELGEEWADEPQVQTQLPVQKKEEIVVAKQEESGRDEIAADVKKPEAQKTAESADKPVATVPATDAKICIVTLTETLEAKDVKDITPADTTDYVIDGTLVTHQLRSGETIIQLAKKYYGDKRLWPYIVKYNWMKDYNHVAIGQMINIPVLKDKAAL